MNVLIFKYFSIFNKILATLFKKLNIYLKHIIIKYKKNSILNISLKIKI